MIVKKNFYVKLDVRLGGILKISKKVNVNPKKVCYYTHGHDKELCTKLLRFIEFCLISIFLFGIVSLWPPLPKCPFSFPSMKTYEV